MILKGVVKNIVFYNNQNGYCVLILSADDGDEYTCVGNMPVVSVGEELELEGKVVCHPKFGFTVFRENLEEIDNRSFIAVVCQIARHYHRIGRGGAAVHINKRAL